MLKLKPPTQIIVIIIDGFEKELAVERFQECYNRSDTDNGTIIN